MRSHSPLRVELTRPAQQEKSLGWFYFSTYLMFAVVTALLAQTVGCTSITYPTENGNVTISKFGDTRIGKFTYVRDGESLNIAVENYGSNEKAMDLAQSAIDAAN